MRFRLWNYPARNQGPTDGLSAELMEIVATWVGHFVPRQEYHIGLRPTSVSTASCVNSTTSTTALSPTNSAP